MSALCMATQREGNGKTAPTARRDSRMAKATMITIGRVHGVNARIAPRGAARDRGLKPHCATG
eukprot:3145256-Lingulodinium_polyedra.AAC.1